MVDVCYLLHMTHQANTVCGFSRCKIHKLYSRHSCRANGIVDRCHVQTWILDMLGRGARWAQRYETA